MVSNSRKILLLAIALVMSLAMNAAERDSTEMMALANSFFNGTASRSKSNLAASSSVKKKYTNSMLDGYENNGKQFVVIAKDDRFNAVIGYSDSKAFSDTLPDGLKWWLAKAESSMKTNAESETVKSTASDLLSNAVSTSSVATKVTPFLTTEWGQSGAYNLLTPTINGTHTYTGCGATAMAQCLKYLGYPSASTGTGTYTVSTVTKNRYTNKSDTTTTSHTYTMGQYTYDWTDMVDKYTATSYTSSNSSALAVSQLMMDCGAASQMDYFSDGSSATIDCVTRGLYDNLQCDSNSIRFYQRNLYTESEWANMVYEELNAGYPILYTGQDVDDGGHAFVFDGYDANGLVHVNWGWDGEEDGYYDMSILNPAETGHDLSFSEYQSMVTGIRGKSNLRSYQSQWIVYSDLNVTKSGSNSITYSTDGVYNFGTMFFKGLIALVAKSSSGTYTVIDQLSTGKYINLCGGYSLSSSRPVSLSSLSSGTYTLLMATEGYDGNSSLESSWQPMRAYEGTVNSYTIVKSSTGITLTANKASYSTTGIENVQSDGESADDGTTRVYNTQGQLIYSSLTSSFSESDIPATNGVVIIKQGNTVKKVALK